MILVIRTDKPEAEVGLYEKAKKLEYETWQAHRELSQTIHQKIGKLLESQKTDWAGLAAVIVFAGPGSFTGLRIGASVANALAESLDIPVIGAKGENWIEDGISKIKRGENDKIVIPDYGRGARITQPRK